jgi:hypothetical protein
MQTKADEELIEETTEIFFSSAVEKLDDIADIIELKNNREITPNQACLLIENVLEAKIITFP